MLRKRLLALAPGSRFDAASRSIPVSQNLWERAEILGEFGTWELEGSSLTLTCSSRIYHIFDCVESEALDLKTFFSFFTADAATTIRRALLTAVSSTTSFDEVLQFSTANGRPGWLRVIAHAALDSTGEWRLVGLVRDVTGEHYTERHLRALALRDSLTGLPNRRYLHQRMEDLTADPAHPPFALVLIDLDNFKSINDRDGQMKGDLFLSELGHTLSAAIGEAICVARIGGNEFAVVLPGIDSAERARAAVASLRERVARHINSGMMSYATGISLFPKNGTRPDQLLQAAAIALKCAKAAGYNQTFAFTHKVGKETERRERLLAELRVGLAAGQLIVYYQPIVDLRSSIIRGWEALVLWQHPRRGLLQPGEFLPFLDNNDTLAVDIDLYVLDQGLAQMRRWLNAGLPVTGVSINVSAQQLRREDCVSEIVSALNLYDLTPDRLKLEILESAFFGDKIEMVAETIGRLSALGVVCSLDDFGTGYASLTHLKRFKVERIKIDRSFIKNIEHDRHDKAITRSVADLGRNLGIRVTAEGIETLEQLRIVQDCGCDCGQGYLFGRPMPADLVPALLSEWNAGRGAAILHGEAQEASCLRVS